MKKRRNRIYRRIAVALTVALLAGQSQAFVLAEEGDAPQTEISAEKTDTDILDSGSETGGGNNDGADNQDSEDIENKEEQQENEEEKGECICDTKCVEDAVNTDCPVCAADYAACAKNAGVGGKLPEEIALEEVLTADEGAVSLAEDAAREYVNGGLIDVTDSVFSYYVLDIDKKEASIRVLDSNRDSLPADMTIPGTVTDVNNIEWKIKEIGGLGFQGCTNLTNVTISEGITTIGSRAFSSCTNLVSVSIPDTVTSIEVGAFVSCKNLQEAEIPNGVTQISASVFEYCDSLKSVTLPSHITSIGQMAFFWCKNLENVNLPDSVTSIGDKAFIGCAKMNPVNLKNVKQIGSYAFRGCESMNPITIPAQLESMGEFAFADCTGWTSDENGNQNIVIHGSLDKISVSTFQGCTGLTEMMIFDSVTGIEDSAFKMCSNLHTLNIAVSNSATSIPVKDLAVFEGCPAPRQIVFWNADGTAKLTGPALDQAKLTYLNASDGDTTDDLWYGWSIDRPVVYDVTINVKIDGSPWDAHGKTFALLPDSGGDFLEVSGTPEAGTYKFSGVSNGTYSIYDITGVSPDTLSSGARAAGMDTGVDVTVQDDNAEETVNYYTATFYDRDADDKAVAYENDTDQRQQIVLGGQKVTMPITNPAEPKDPGKAGYVFDGWKTEDGVAYDFEVTVGGKQEIYASWREADAPVTSFAIIAMAGEGGSINPPGRVSVKKGDNKPFTITPNAGYRIKAVTVDGTDRTAELADAPGGGKSYTFINVTGDHTIRAEFEKDGNGGGDNPDPNPNPNPNPNPDPGGGNGGGGGDDDDDNKKPGGGSGGGSGDSGGDNNNPGGDNGGGSGGSGDGGDGVGNGQTTAGTENVSAQAVGGAAGISADGSKAAGSSAVASDGGKAAKGTASGASGGTEGATGTAANGKEPKTGDASYLQVYATLAMIAGLTYLLLYVLEESRGMTEREKKAFVAAFIRWGKKGGAFRKCCAVAAIFCLLAYYHIIGKNVGGNTLRDKYLGQAF